jgi:adenosylmethionine-8-amino-7-oxononanoate aminotransferase
MKFPFPTPPEWYEQGLPHIWLPYCQMKTARPPLPVVGTEGCRIQLSDGTEMIDGISSWWSAAHGYNHPYLLAAVEKQLKTMPHVMFGGLVHEPALSLARRLCHIAPEGLERVFFSDSGSTAVEVALKMALQYWKNKGEPSRNRFLCFQNGYHGDTMGAMAVSDPDSIHKAFRNNVPKHYVVPLPQDEYSFAELEETICGVAKQLAGIIIEPLVQGAGGMRFHTPDVLSAIYRIAKQNDILFIADEIATGFGRTGFMFACDEAGITPDILCLGKGMTGGIMTLAATLATGEVFEAFLSDDYMSALMHGPTYMANPLACAAAHASLDLFENEPRIQQVEAIETQLRQELKKCATLPGVVEVRVKGAIGVVQMESASFDLHWFRRLFIEERVWIRPIEDVIYLMPPLVISAAELTRLTDAIYLAIQQWAERKPAE